MTTPIYTHRITTVEFVRYLVARYDETIADALEQARAARNDDGFIVIRSILTRDEFLNPNI